MTSKYLIGFGGFKQSGKDAAADYLVSHFRWRKSFMSEPLKRASETLNAWMRISPDEWRKFTHAQRTALIVVSAAKLGEFVRAGDLVKILGYEGAKKIQEYRDHLQLLGTDVGRKIIDEDAWIKIAKREIDQSPISTSLTGIRFRNELEFIKQNDGVSVWVERASARDAALLDFHESEWTLGPDDFDIGVDNNGTLEELYAKVDKIVNAL